MDTCAAKIGVVYPRADGSLYIIGVYVILLVLVVVVVKRVSAKGFLGNGTGDLQSFHDPEGKVFWSFNVYIY